MRLLIQFKYILFLSILVFFSCQKKETITVTNNEPPIVNQVPIVKIENYVNRIFIDLLGREPLDSEMSSEVQTLKNAGLSKTAREALITKLQTNTDFIIGDTSYLRAYHQQLYNLSKVRLIEGVSDERIRVEFLVNIEDTADSIRMENVLSSRADMQNGLITFDQMLARMVHNVVYDQVNMNTFNFVNATFENLLWRFPTNEEFDSGYDMVEFNISTTLFSEAGQNKADYVSIISSSREMFEGNIIWAYRQLLARVPTTEETAFLLEDYFTHRDIALVQKHVMTTDEYANF